MQWKKLNFWRQNWHWIYFRQSIGSIFPIFYDSEMQPQTEIKPQISCALHWSAGFNFDCFASKLLRIVCKSTLLQLLFRWVVANISMEEERGIHTFDETGTERVKKKRREKSSNSYVFPIKRETALSERFKRATYIYNFYQATNFPLHGKSKTPLSSLSEKMEHRDRERRRQTEKGEDRDR